MRASRAPPRADDDRRANRRPGASERAREDLLGLEISRAYLRPLQAQLSDLLKAHVVRDDAMRFIGDVRTFLVDEAASDAQP